ncbi:MAG: hypothetical protein AABW48_04315 [Nanoarchaeota archaeon]
MKNQQSIEDRLKADSEEFIWVTDCNPEPSLVKEMRKELVFLKCANKVAAAETIAVGYLTIVYLGCRPLCVTATLLAAGMFGYSAYHIYDSSKKIKEMENKPER